jgi:Acetyltransferase (GNAT) domain
MLGAFDDGRLVGVLGYQRSGDVVDVDRLAVSTAHFRKGLGRRLREALHVRKSVSFDDRDRYTRSRSAAMVG